MRLSIIYIIFIMVSYSCNAFALPEGFVYLEEVDPTIVQDLRYYTNENFIGRKLVGYKSNKVILTKQAAEALSKAQKAFLEDGYSLVVYDGYRPQQTVDFFIKWAADVTDQAEKEKYYPAINKADVFKLGYVAEKSGHSRGSTADLTIIKRGNSLKVPEVQKRQLTDGSHHDSKLITPETLTMRNYLRNMMKKHGFHEYKEEWWHYTLKDEPFPNTYFNFEVK